jgi:imidazolonepropionase-like amidohydrolase
VARRVSAARIGLDSFFAAQLYQPMQILGPGLWRMLRWSGCLVAAFAPLLRAETAEPAAPTVTVYTHVTIIDGTGAPPAANMAIVVEGERIRAVGSMATLTPVPGATMVDLTGKFALPGLIDTHQHLGTSPNRRAAEAQLCRMLYGGVTAVRDMAGDGRFLAELSRSARLAEIPAPDIRFSALMAGPSFFADPRTHAAAQGATPGQVPWLQAVTAETDMVTAVAMARGTGAAGIKIYANLPPAEVRRIIAEAHRQGFPVWSHATIFPTSPAEVVEDGIDSISHAYMLAYQVSETIPAAYAPRPPIDPARLGADTTVLPALYAAMVRHGTILDATVHTFFEADLKRKPGTPARGPVGAQITAAASHAGVAVSAGTDFVAPPDAAYPALQIELETLVRDVGLTPADALRAATSVAARALKADADMGTLAPGKLANLVFVARNPLDDITALRTVVLTVKRGRAYPRTDYRQPDPKILDEDY